MHRGRFAQAGLLAAGLVMCGCKPKVEPLTPPPDQGNVPAPVAAQPIQPIPVVAVATAPTQLMPEGTGFVVSVASVRHALRVVDLPALITRYRPQYDQAAAAVEQSVGTNLLDPARWPEIGVNPDGPLGGALFNTDAEAGCFFFSLSDPLRFREFIDRFGATMGGRLVPIFEDRGVVLGNDQGNGPVFVLRDNFAFFVIVGRPARAPFDYARQLASVDPARGLSATPRWQKALAGTTGPRDLFAYVDIGGMVQAEIDARRARSDNPEPNWAETELQRLRDQGSAPAEEVERWEKMAAEQRVAEAQLRERERKSQAFITSVFGPLGPLVFEFSLGDRAVAGSVRVDAPESSTLRKVLRGSGPPLAVDAAAHRVVFGASARLDVMEALLALDDLLKSEGESLDKAFADLKRELGVDPRAFLGALDGSVSFAWTLDDPSALTSDKPLKGQGFNLAIGLKNTSEAQALLDVVGLKLPPPLRARRDLKTRSLLVTGTEWRDVHVTVTGQQLTVSTDREFARSLARGAPNTPAKLQPASAAPVVAAPDAAGAVFMDYLLPMGLFMARSSSSYRYDPTTNQPYWRFQDLAHDKIDAVPQSPAYKAKLREWNAVDAKVRKAEEQRERTQTGLVLKIAESVGSLAFNLRETPQGLRAEGGHYFGPGGLTRTIEQTVDTVSNRIDGDAAMEFYEKRSRIENEMQEIRVRDIEKALGVRAPTN